MSGMVGADLEQVRALAASFDRAAAQLNQTSGQVRKGIQISAWVGPFAVRFRHTWDSDHSVKLRQAANALAAQAKQLRLEADRQERASAAATGSTAPPRTLDGSTRSLLNLDLDDEDGDGVVITEVLGEDGERRFIVTIGGTSPLAGPLSNFDAVENFDAVLGNTTQTMRYVEELMREHGIQPSDDVMLVGYSQGGLIAQNIANSGRWGDPLIVTWASPQVQGGVGSHDIIRFEVEGDLVSDGLRLASLYIPDQEGDNYRVRGDAGADSGDRFVSPVGAAKAFGEGLAIHTVGHKPFYGNLADEFDTRDDTYARRLRERMSPYVNGSIMSSS